MSQSTDAPATDGYTFTKPEGLLAHYTTASAAFEHILPSGQLRLSPYRVMRDAVENKDITPSIGWWGSPPRADEAIREVYGGLKLARDRMRVLSLTRDAEHRAGLHANFDCCWARPRMWEQYGEKHRGVCLLFDAAALRSAVEAQWPREHVDMRHVVYTREGFAVSAARHLTDDRMFKGKTPAQVVADYLDTHRDELLFLKSDDFATEHEYRVVLTEGDNDYAFLDMGDALVGVVLGEQFPSWQRPGAVERSRAFDVNLGRMHWEHGRPHVLRVSP